jgi:Lon protease-like protein
VAGDTVAQRLKDAAAAFPAGNPGDAATRVGPLISEAAALRAGEVLGFFGVVALQAGSEVRKAGAAAEQLHAVGTLARIVQLQQPQPGLLHLQCEGTQRFRIQEHRQLPHGLWVADVQMLEADTVVPIPEHLRATAQALAQVLMQLHARSTDADHARLPSAEQMADCGWVANRWTELLPLPVSIKQQLMALDSPLVRLELVADVLERSGIGHAQGPAPGAPPAAH